MTAVLVCICLQAAVSRNVETAEDSVQFQVEVTGSHMLNRKDSPW